MRHTLGHRSSLSDQTNESESRPSKEEEPDESLNVPKGLRRTASFQFGHSRVSSSSTNGSEDDGSIYNASATTSEPDLPNTYNDWQSLSTLPTYSPSSQPKEPNPRDDRLFGWLDLQRPRAPEARVTTPSKSHSKWPIKQLETITEQRSIATLGPSTSVSTIPRQASRPSIIAQISAGEASEGPGQNTPDSSTLETPNRQPKLESISEVPKASHRRCFSLNDLDCLPRLPPRRRPSPEKSSSSSSASDSSLKYASTLRDLCFFPASPARPVRPPPVRVQTPPGLPSFGTREAASYVSPGRRRRARHESPSESHIPTTDINAAASLNPTTSQDPPPTPHTDSRSRTHRILDILTFSTPEPVSFSQPPPYSSRSTAPLPPEVLYASNGTRIRGRFSARHSGHGVGGGGEGWHGLESHPFHRAPVAEAEVEVDDSAEEALERGRASWEPRGRPGEPVMTGAIQDFLAAGEAGGPRSEERLRERLREDQRRQREEESWAHKGCRWFCMACCAWDVDDGSRLAERRAAAHGGGSSGYMAGSSMTY
ncbi:MAG: hypothetical protein Q9160_004887 [Pyrenula sp. 1 TL-2023]